MTISNTKTDSKTITKEQLEELYFVQNMSLNQIGLHFGYIDRQPIIRLFKKFNIKSRSKKEQQKIIYDKKYNIPAKEVLQSELGSFSISKLSEKYNVSRSVLSKWLKYYNIQSDYFVNHIDKDVLNKEINEYTIFELMEKYNTDAQSIKQRLSHFPKKIISKEKLKEIIGKLDVNNPGFTKQIKLVDDNVYESVLHHTQDHILSTEKISERVYRIINDYDKDQIKRCINTNEPLKFYTMKKGYGYSDLSVSKEGFVWTEIFNIGCSKISQKLFWEIYNSCDKEMQSNMKFYELNSEVKINIPQNLVSEQSNKYAYSADFMLGKRLIEFDGDYWHGRESVKMKDVCRDNILSQLGYTTLRIAENDYRNNPKETLQECLIFLRQ